MFSGATRFRTEVLLDDSFPGIKRRQSGRRLIAVSLLMVAAAVIVSGDRASDRGGKGAGVRVRLAAP